MKSIVLPAAAILMLAAGFRLTTDPSAMRTTPAAAAPHEQAGVRGLEAGYAYEALQWQYRLRAHPAGRIPEGWRERALEQISAMKSRQAAAPSEAAESGGETLSAVTWQSVGPDNVGGRIRSIAVDPSNSNIVYCGSVSGGIWKSTDAGGSWFPIGDTAANLVIGAIAVDPNNSNVIFAGTGEGYFNIDALRGAGMLKSTNGGATWALTTTFGAAPYGYPYYINDIYIRPDNSLIVYAATNTGLFRSTNGGAGFSVITKTTGTRRATQIVADEFNPSTMYVAYGNFSTDGIWKSTDGLAFSKLAGGLPTTGFERISLAISKGDPSVLYAVLTDAATYGTHSVWKTTNAGANWTEVATPNDGLLGGTHLGNQGWYNNVVAVHPTDFDRVYVGGINSFRSTNGGLSWSQMTHGYPSGLPFMHVDQHAIEFDPDNPSIMYFGNDGGMYKTVDGGTSFSAINQGLAVTQFYSGAAHPSAGTYFGGTQDNGTVRTVAQPAWTQTLGGDGGYTAVDFAAPTNVYTEYVYLNFQKSTNSGTNWSRQMTGIPTSGGSQSDGTSDRCAFIAPFVMDPSNPQTLYAGTYRVYRTTNGASLWSAVSPDLTGETGGPGGVGSLGSVISAIAVARSAPVTVYAGTTGFDSSSRVWVTTNGGTNWLNRTEPPLPNRSVTAIAVDPTNEDRAYVGFSGYNASTPTAPGHVFRTVNGGLSWANVSGNLPDVPVNAIALDTASASMHIIIGTDLGVYETTNGGTTWAEQNQGMARVAVFDLDLRASDGVLFASTHGRGMFRTPGSVITGVEDGAPAGVPASHRLLQNYPNPFNPSTTIAFDVAEASEVSLKVYDSAGRQVSELAAGRFTPGSYERTFDGSTLASGVYFYTLRLREAGGAPRSETRKMLLVR